MVPQTIQATASKNKGFTLVELIVVITILAILGTIGFLSLQGYSGQSRDSKRTSDMRSLSTAITTKGTEGISLISVASNTTNARLTTANFGGTGAINGTDYEAGVPNYTVLGLNASNFKDPLGSEYRVAASTKSNGVFQVAAKMEPSGSSANGIASVTGNYVPRTSSGFVATGTNGSTSITGIQSSSVGLIKKGDVIFATGPNAAYTVSSVGGDGLSLTLTTSLTGAVTSIRLGNVSGGLSETSGLIGANGSLANAVVDQGGTYLPY